MAARTDTATRAMTTPSIAVLPFSNLSADKDQDYFSDGLAEDLIHLLAQMSGLKVIARTSAFAFKGQQTDIRTIADALGVANIFEGSVRCWATGFRVTAQLVAAADGSHLWSERYDRQWADVFDVQDEIAAAIAAASLQSCSNWRTSGSPALNGSCVTLLWRSIRGRAIPRHLATRQDLSIERETEGRQSGRRREAFQFGRGPVEGGVALFA